MKIIEELRKEFEENSNEYRKNWSKSYMRNKFIFFGVDTKKRREICKKYLKVSKIDWELLKECYQQKEREFHYFALDYLLKNKKLLSLNDLDNLYYFAKNNQWWDSIDTLDGIYGSIEGIEKTMLKYSTDEDFWLRRIAIDFQLDKKDKTNKELLETIICNNFGSNEFFINKAIGWSLREYSKTNKEWVVDFVNRYEDKLSNLSKREALKIINKIKNK